MWLEPPRLPRVRPATLRPKTPTTRGNEPRTTLERFGSANARGERSRQEAVRFRAGRRHRSPTSTPVTLKRDDRQDEARLAVILVNLVATKKSPRHCESVWGTRMSGLQGHVNRASHRFRQAFAFKASRISASNFSVDVGSGGAAGAAASSFFFIEFMALTSMNTQKAMIRKSNVVCRKLP